jgi:hypothetical protein
MEGIWKNKEKNEKKRWEKGKDEEKRFESEKEKGWEVIEKGKGEGAKEEGGQEEI